MNHFTHFTSSNTSVWLNQWLNIIYPVFLLNTFCAELCCLISVVVVVCLTLQVKSVYRKQKKASVLFIDDTLLHKKRG